MSDRSNWTGKMNRTLQDAGWSGGLSSESGSELRAIKWLLVALIVCVVIFA